MTGTHDVDLLRELEWRGLLYQKTDGVGAALERGPVSGYVGFDPTASSLHVGNLVPVMGLVHLQRAGHRPVVLVGGGTGMIGDPSGRTSERQLLTTDQVHANAASIRDQLKRFLSFDGETGAIMRNNADWLLSLGAVELMRDVGKHFSVNVMLAKESVKSRMESGISYTEFSYMLLQAYDFLQLHRSDGVTLQLGGSDQWGNITAGTDLVRRVEGAEAHGITLPLVTTASGAKFGKSEAGAVWLDPSMTSPYRFYQFWYNTDDRDAIRYLKMFTLLSQGEIEGLRAESESHPERREAQRMLARDVTTRVHGPEAARIAGELSTLLFGGGDASSLSPAALTALAGEVPFAEVATGEEGVDLLEALTATGLVASKGAARRLLDQGGVYVNGERAGSSLRHIPPAKLLEGEHLLLRKGAREYGLVRVRG
jgi:tyrosyl-tRNA synthetase